MLGPANKRKSIVKRLFDLMNSTQSPSANTSGRWFMIGIGIALVMIGSLFVWLLGRSFLRAYEMKSWPEVACVIVSSYIEERIHDPQSPPEYRHNLSFGYEWQGKALTSDKFTLRGSPWSSSQNNAANGLKLYPPGSSQHCKVNPQQPEIAVLKTDSLAPGYSIWFPCLFVVGGIGIIIRAIRPKRL
jgi:hypothetical protein